MLSVLRKVRKQLLAKGSIYSYMLYAIGEILLVVIGILIALGINNWNENRKDRIAEQQILQSLHEEFIQNKQILKVAMEGANKSITSCYDLMELMREVPTQKQIKLADSLIYLSIEHNAFNYSNNTFTEIVQAGKISMLLDNDLKSQLFEWGRTLNNVDKAVEYFMNWLNEGVIPYLAKNVALKNVDQYSPMAWKMKSRFAEDFDKVLNDREFENLVDNNLYHRLLLMEDLKRLEKMIAEILEKTKRS